MSKYYGAVGYSETVEVALDVWQEQITERMYAGDVLKNNLKWAGSEHLNDNLTISNRVSIVADPYAFQNQKNIRYCTLRGTKWKVSSIEIQYPRLILELGGVYNEQS